MTSQETRTLPSRRQVLMPASSKRGEDDLDAAMLKVEATKSRFASSPRFVARARPLARTVARKLPKLAHLLRLVNPALQLPVAAQ